MTATSTHAFGLPGGPWDRLSPFARAQLIGWSLFALVDLVNRQLAYQDFPAAFAITAAVFPVMIGLSAGLRSIYNRFLPGNALQPAALAAIVLVSCVGAALIVATISAMREIFGWSIPHWRPVEEIALPLVHYAVVLIGWSLLFFWIRSDRQRLVEHQAASVAQAEALRAEIQQLRLQISPHFLFNALNGIAEEVPEHSATALAMLRDLTDYLRYVLAGIRTPVVPVEAEVAALGAYLRIQQARFGARLRTQIEMDPAAAAFPIANSLLQPIAENAIEYGDRTDVLELTVSVRREGEALRVDISNTGQLEPAHRPRAGHGLGIDNLRRRLDAHYPGRHFFDLRQIESEPGKPGGARVVAILLLEGEVCSAS